jgi:hypothetical protein
MNSVTSQTITQSDFFALPQVIALQEIQKRNPYGSAQHRKAHDDIVAIASSHGVASFFGGY